MSITFCTHSNSVKIKDVDRFMSDENKKGKETLTSEKYISYHIAF